MKISGDSKSFSKNNNFHKINEKRVVSSSGNALSENVGSTIWRLHWRNMRVKLELKMEQMWRLIGRLVGTYVLIARWELLISLDACLVIILIWDIDMLITLIDYLDCRCWGSDFSVFYWYICLGHWHVDLCWLIILPVLA